MLLNWLVVYLPRKMMDFVSWDDDIPNWMENWKMFQTTNQCYWSGVTHMKMGTVPLMFDCWQCLHMPSVSMFQWTQYEEIVIRLSWMGWKNISHVYIYIFIYMVHIAYLHTLHYMYRIPAYITSDVGTWHNLPWTSPRDIDVDSSKGDHVASKGAPLNRPESSRRVVSEQIWRVQLLAIWTCPKLFLS